MPCALRDSDRLLADCSLGGMSSSLPEDVQYRMYRTVAGLEHVKIVRNAYAIEYYPQWKGNILGQSLQSCLSTGGSGPNFPV